MPRRVLLRDAGGVMAAMVLVGGEPRVASAAGRDLMDLRYQMRFGGVQVGTARFTARVEEERVSLRLRTEIEGLMGLMASRSSDLRTELIDDGAVIRPVRFRGREKREDRVREAVLRYDAAGAVETVELEQNGKERKSEVPVAARAGTTDMLTALWRVRAGLLDGGKEGSRFAVFDGRKRFEVTARPRGDGAATDTIEVEIVPVSEGERDDEDRPLRIIATDLSRELVPRQVTGRRRPPWEAVLDEG